MQITMQVERVIGRFRHARPDFLLVLLISLSLFPLIALPWLQFLAPLRLLLAFIYVLYITGYCLTAALFPGADDLESTERIGLSLGLSVAWVPVLALILDRLPWGLHLWPILLGEVGSTLIFMAVAMWRQSQLPYGEAFVPDLSWRPQPWWRSLSQPEKRIYSITFGTLLVATLSLLWILLVPSPAEYMTEFYMLGKGDLAEDFPREAIVDQDLWVILGITNRERARHTYRVEVWVTDPWRPGKHQQVGQAGPLTLARDENWELPIIWRMPWSGQDQEVEFLLFIDDGSEPYRRLRLFLNVEAENTTTSPLFTNQEGH